MDNFFSAYDLADLLTLGFRATDTVREVRLKKYPLEEMKESDKYVRRSYDYKCDRKVLAVKWKDNKSACLASNYDVLNRWSSD
jgi:membrane-bound inhibitor of C-type lysozyme